MPSDTAPDAILYARIYAAAMTLMYVLCTVGGVLLMLLPGAWDSGGPDLPPGIQGAIMAVVGLPFAALCSVAIFVGRRKWAYMLHFALMALGATSCLCLPVSLPLLIRWMKPDVKAWYGA